MCGRYEQTYFDMLVMRVHGALLRGTITYRKSYVKAIQPDMEGKRKELVKQAPREFDLMVNVSDVVHIMLEELHSRARGWQVSADLMHREGKAARTTA